MKKIDLLNEQSSKLEEKEKIENVNISKHELIEDSPFTAIKVKNKWFIVMGDQIASGNKFDTLDDLREYIDTKPWELIVTASTIFNSIIKRNKEKEVKNAK